MIVYAGKQYWNEFNNGDEALFQDANRPRDDEKFKIRPWLQSDKWKQREVNKDISTEAAQLVVMWINKAWAFSSLPQDYSIPYFKETYSASDLSSYNWYQTAWGSTWGSSELNYYANLMSQRKSGNPWCRIKDWNIEITEDGTYIIQAFAQFVFPSGYSSSNSYQYQERVVLLGRQDNEWKVQHRNQGRACGTADMLLTWQASWLTKWEIYNIWAAHTYSSNVVMFETLNIQKLR